MRTAIKSQVPVFYVLAGLLLAFCNGVYAQETRIQGMDKLAWEQVMPGIWKATVGESGLNALDYAGAPKEEAIEVLGDRPFPFSGDSSYYQVLPGRVSIRLPLDETEKLYGLGLEFEGMNRRGNVYTLKVDHYGGNKGYTHAPVPFYISSKGYGVLINSARRVKIHAGVGNRKDSRKPEAIDRTTGKNWSARPLSDAVEATIQGSGLEVFVFCGNTPLEAVQRYNLYCGGGVLPPKWGLGFWHRMHTKSSDTDVHEEIGAFEKNNFPLDVIGLEPGWQDFAYPCSYDWDSIRFPEPEDFVKTLGEKGIKVNLWENPYVASTSSMYPGIAPFTGSHTVWLGEVPDYTLPEARKVLLDHHQKNHLDLGVSGYKIDEVDGYDFWLWPDHATFPSGNDAVEIRQLYGLIMQDMFSRHFKMQNKRTLGLVRSSYTGASNHPFVIYSDHYSHKGYVTALANSSLCGVLWTPEIRSASSPEEWIRRFQTVCFSPLMMLNAWASGTKPWSFPGVSDMVRENIRLRMQLLPYLYTSFHSYSQEGIPPFRAMVLEEGFDTREELSAGQLDDAENPYAERSRIEVTDQYMMGPFILVAPVFEGQKEREVLLPAGNWYDFYTGEYAGNGESIRIKTTLEKIPLFVKDGGIIPMLPDPARPGVSQPLEVRCYGSRENTYLLYNDDGDSFDYENGEYTLSELKVERNRKGKPSAKHTVIYGGEHAYGAISWRWMGSSEME